jgi:AMMECR1 domain-containing protein
LSFESIGDEKVLKVIKDSIIKAVDEPTFVRVKGIDFQDGIIEVSVLSCLLKTARPSDRGFIRTEGYFKDLKVTIY